MRRLVLDHDDMGPQVHGLPAGKPATSRRLVQLCRGLALVSSIPRPPFCASVAVPPGRLPKATVSQDRNDTLKAAPVLKLQL